MENEIKLYIVRIQPAGIGTTLYVEMSDGTVIMSLTKETAKAKSFSFEEAAEIVSAINQRWPQPLVERQLPIGDYRAVGLVYAGRIDRDSCEAARMQVWHLN